MIISQHKVLFSEKKKKQKKKLIFGFISFAKMGFEKKSQNNFFSPGPPLQICCSPFLHRHANVDHLDSGSAVHFYTGMQMWIIWTLGVQSIAQTSTNKQVCRMIQAYSFSMNQFQ